MKSPYSGSQTQESSSPAQPAAYILGRKMQMIKSRKHAQSRFNQQMSAALAVMLLPVAAHAADAGTDPVIVAGSNQALQEVKVRGDVINDFKAVNFTTAENTEKLV